MSGTTKLTNGLLFLAIFLMGAEASGDVLILKSGAKLKNGKVTRMARGNYEFVGQNGKRRYFREDEVLRVINKDVNWPKPPLTKAFNKFRKSVSLGTKAFDAALAKAEAKNAVEPDTRNPEQPAKPPEEEAVKNDEAEPEQRADDPDVEKALEYFGKSAALAKKTLDLSLVKARKIHAAERKKDVAGNAGRSRKAAAIYGAVRGAWVRMGKRPNRSMTRVVQSSPVAFNIMINGHNIKNQLARTKSAAADAARRLREKLPRPETERRHKQDKAKFVEARKAIEKAKEVLREATTELHPPPELRGVKPDIKKWRDALSKAMNTKAILTLAMIVGLCACTSGKENEQPEPGPKKIIRTEKEWKKRLTPKQFRITRKKGTERAGTGRYNTFYKKGKYICVCCGNELFGSDAKYDSGTGWPSFRKPIGKTNVATATDNSLFRKRTEVLCSRCDAHLGHVFSDGPKPTGLRYCVNSAALKFVPAKKK